MVCSPWCMFSAWSCMLSYHPFYLDDLDHLTKYHYQHYQIRSVDAQHCLRLGYETMYTRYVWMYSYEQDLRTKLDHKSTLNPFNCPGTSSIKSSPHTSHRDTMFTQIIPMTSSNGNICRITGYLCGVFTSDRWIPRTEASDAELWCFLRSVPE